MRTDSSRSGDTKPDVLPDVLTANQAAELLQLHVETVRQLSRDNRLPHRKIGGSYRFSKRRLLEWLDQGD